jgi:hypothetical protein
MNQYHTTHTSAILRTVLSALRCDPAMRFVWADTAFLHLFWQSSRLELMNECGGSIPWGDLLRDVVRTGQLELLHGAWVQHDEAATSLYAAMTQITVGHRWLDATIAPGHRVRTAWQIDPFGHAAASAALFTMAGQSRVVLNRIDFREKARRARERRLEFWWHSSIANASLFVHTLRVHYSAPKVALPEYVTSWLRPAYRDSDARLLLWGDDFRFRFSPEFDTVRDQINRWSSSIDMRIGTMSDYLDGVVARLEPLRHELTERDTDFMPYRENYPDVWTGFYASRARLKTALREAERWLRAAEILSLHSPQFDERLNEARQHIGVLQHHDAVTGTCTKDVAADYFAMARDAEAAAHQALEVRENGAHEQVWTIVNTLPWTRDEIFHVPLSPINGKRVRLESASSLECQVVPLDDDEPARLYVRAKLAPFEALSFAAVPVDNDAPHACELTPFVRLPPNGGGDLLCDAAANECVRLSATRYWSRSGVLFGVPLSSGAYVFRTDPHLTTLVGALCGALLLCCLLAVPPIRRLLATLLPRRVPFSHASVGALCVGAALIGVRVLVTNASGTAAASTLGESAAQALLTMETVNAALTVLTLGCVVVALLGVNARHWVSLAALLGTLYAAWLLQTSSDVAGGGTRVHFDAQQQRVASGRVVRVVALELADDRSRVLIQSTPVSRAFDLDYRVEPLPRDSELMLRFAATFARHGAPQFSTDDQLSLVPRAPFDWHLLQPLPMAFKPMVSAAQVVVDAEQRSLAVFARRACGAALLDSGALELHVTRRILTDDEKGLQDGVGDDDQRLPVHLLLALNVRSPLERARLNVMHEHRPLLVRGRLLSVDARRPRLLLALPDWLHIVAWTALRDNATTPLATAAGSHHLLLHVQNIDSEPHTLAPGLTHFVPATACVATTSTGLELESRLDNNCAKPLQFNSRAVRSFVLSE